jgi:hypothetical protein
VNRVADNYGQRRVMARAKAQVVQPLTFGRFVAPDEFTIGLLAGFQDTPDLDLVKRVAGNLCAEHVATSEDDGTSQTVTVKRGVVKKEQIQLRRVWS